MPTKVLLYPNNWSEIAHEVKEASDWTCQECDKQCRRPGEAFDTHERTLTVAHISQDYTASEVQVVALCSPCHMRFDAAHSWIARLRNLYLQRRIAGQLELFPSR